jgi:hypothetical protein
MPRLTLSGGLASKDSLDRLLKLTEARGLDEVLRRPEFQSGDRRLDASDAGTAPRRTACFASAASSSATAAAERGSRRSSSRARPGPPSCRRVFEIWRPE